MKTFAIVLGCVILAVVLVAAGVDRSDPLGRVRGHHSPRLANDGHRDDERQLG
jgi:hypothetical protein